MPIAAAIPAIIGGVSSLAGGLIKGNAAGNAATAASTAATNAANYAKNNLNNAQGFINNQQNLETGNLQPFLNTGSSAANTLAQYMKTPGQGLLQTFDQQFQAPTAATEQNDPGYQFRLDQGQKALERSAAAKGNLLTGGTAKAEQQFGQDYASNEYGNVYNRALQQYLTNQTNFNTNQNNLYTRLSGTAGLGLQAGSSLNSALGQNAALNTNALLDTSRLVGGFGEDAGAAQAAGQLGQGNALAGMVSGLGTSAASLPWSTWFPQSATNSLANMTLPGMSQAQTLPGSTAMQIPTWNPQPQAVRNSMYGN